MAARSEALRRPEGRLVAQLIAECQSGSLDAESIERHMDVALEGLGARTAQR